MKKDPLDDILELLLLSYKKKDWKYVEVAIRGLISSSISNKKNSKKLKKQLEDMQINNHTLHNKLKGFNE